MSWYGFTFGSSLMLTVCLIGTGSNFSMAFVEFRALKKQSMKCSPFQALLLSMFIGDFILCFSHAIVFLLNLSYSGWVSNIACQFQASTAILFCAGSFLSLGFIAIDRALVLVHEYKLTKCHLYSGIISIWILVIVTALVPIFVPQSYPISVTPATHLCMVEWWYDSPSMKSYVWWCSSTLCVTLLVIIICHLQIYWKSQKVQSEASRYIPNQKESFLHHRKNHDIACRLTLLVVTFFICWIVYLINMWIQASTHQPPLLLMELLSTFLAYLNSAFNPFLYSIVSHWQDQKNQKLQQRMEASAQVASIEKKVDSSTLALVTKKMSKVPKPCLTIRTDSILSKSGYKIKKVTEEKTFSVISSSLFIEVTPPATPSPPFLSSFSSSSFSSSPSATTCSSPLSSICTSSSSSSLSCSSCSSYSSSPSSSETSPSSSSSSSASFFLSPSPPSKTLEGLSSFHERERVLNIFSPSITRRFDDLLSPSDAVLARKKSCFSFSSSSSSSSSSSNQQIFTNNNNNNKTTI